MRGSGWLIWARRSHGSNFGDLFAYAGAAVAVVLGYSLRWRLVMQATAKLPPLRRLVAARLAGDAVGALLPGGKIGGDPVRIALTAGDGRGGVRASASVAIDRVMELFSNSVCAIVYVSIFSVTRVEAAPGASLVLLATLRCPLLALLALVGVLRAQRRPFTPAAGVAGAARARGCAVCSTRAANGGPADRVLSRSSAALRARLAGSLLIELAIIGEYHFLLAAFGITLDLPTLLVVVLASGLSRIVPTPGGWGRSKPARSTVLGLASGRPEVGFVVGMVLRLHETLWTLVGVLLLVTQGMSFARLRVLAARKAVA